MITVTNVFIINFILILFFALLFILSIEFWNEKISKFCLIGMFFNLFVQLVCILLFAMGIK